MKFLTLEEIKKRENSRKRVIRKRLREEHIKKFQFQSQYAKAKRTAEKDYLAVQDILKVGQQNSGPKELMRNSRGLPPTCQQKFLLLMQFISQSLHDKSEMDDSLMLHTYALALVELRKPNSQALRVFSGSSQLAELESIHTWGDLRDRVQQVTTKNTGLLKHLTETLIQSPKKVSIPEIHAERLQDQLALLYAQTEELNHLIGSGAHLKQRDQAFLYNLMLNMGFNTLGIAGSIKMLGAAVLAEALIPIILISALLMASSAVLFNQVKDSAEYADNWDNEETGLRETFGTTLGLSLEVLDLGLTAISTTHLLSQLGRKTLFKSSRQMRRRITRLYLLTNSRPKSYHPGAFFGVLNNAVKGVRVTRSFFQDVFPELRNIASSHPDANFEKLFRGLLSTGVDVASFGSKAIRKSTPYQSAQLVQSIWKTISKGKSLIKETRK